MKYVSPVAISNGSIAEPRAQLGAERTNVVHSKPISASSACSIDRSTWLGDRSRRTRRCRC